MDKTKYRVTTNGVKFRVEVYARNIFGYNPQWRALPGIVFATQRGAELYIKALLAETHEWVPVE